MIDSCNNIVMNNGITEYFEDMKNMMAVFAVYPMLLQ